jgi:hypothetical protein
MIEFAHWFIPFSFMNRNRLVYLISVVVLSAGPCLAEVWTTATSYSNAVAQAKDEGKLILADFGHSGCDNCVAMDSHFHSTSPGISQQIQAGFVYWGEDYQGADTRPWTAGFVGALPYVCYIDPGSLPGSAVSTSSGLIDSGSLFLALRNLSYKLPLVVTNVPGAILGTNALSNGKLTLGGLACTNSALTNAIRGIAIANVMWRVHADDLPGGAFAPVPRIAPMNSTFVSWAADFAPINGTNTFESYVHYANGADSWTNKARFAYLGTPVETQFVISLSRANTYFAQGSTGGFTLGGVGAASRTYVLLAASNCVSPMVWTPIATNTADLNGALSFSDHQATNLQQRFYRVGTL